MSSNTAEKEKSGRTSIFCQIYNQFGTEVTFFFYSSTHSVMFIQNSLFKISLNFKVCKEPYTIYTNVIVTGGNQRNSAAAELLTD